MFGFKKKKVERSDFIISDTDIRRFNSRKKKKRKLSKEEKRKAKLEKLRSKAKRIREDNKVRKELEDARSNRSRIRKKSFERRTRSIKAGIKKVKKRSKGYVSSSPFAPEKWK